MTPELRKRIETYSGLPHVWGANAARFIDDLIAALEAADPVADAVEWCREHGADVEFNHFPGEAPEVVVKCLTVEWKSATAPTFVEAVAKLKERETQ